MDVLILLACVVAFSASAFALMMLRPWAVKVGLVDCPGGGRKCHDGNIPLVGGLAFFFGALMANFVLGMDALGWVLFVLGGLILFVGAIDDGYELGVRTRLAGQVLVAMAFVWMTGAFVDHAGITWQGKEVQLGAWGVPLTVIGIVGVINAFNLLDGMDGLAGSVGLVALMFLFAATGGSMPVLLLLAVALLPFLAANLGIWEGHKVFMGDAGSTFLGFAVAACAVYAVSAQPEQVRMVDALWFMAVPLMDTAAVIVRRVREGQSPFQPDSNHLHHLVLRTGCSRGMTLGLIVGASAGFASIGWALRMVSAEASLGALLVLSVCYLAGFEASLRGICFLFRSEMEEPEGFAPPKRTNAVRRSRV